MEHIIARKHRGASSAENLALACMRCNSYKGPNLSGIDPETASIVTLFNPRTDEWAAHFRWGGAMLIGKTAVARATIAVLEINHPWRVKARQRLMHEGRFEAR